MRCKIDIIKDYVVTTFCRQYNFSGKLTVFLEELIKKDTCLTVIESYSFDSICELLNEFSSLYPDYDSDNILILKIEDTKDKELYLEMGFAYLDKTIFGTSLFIASNKAGINLQSIMEKNEIPAKDKE